MADKSNSEVDHLMKIKVRLEEDLQEMKKVLDSNKRTVNEHLSKISQLTNEVNDCQSKTKQLGD
jgi:archaellum component FlaC